MRAEFLYNELKRNVNEQNYIEKENLLIFLNRSERNITDLFYDLFIADDDFKRNQIFIQFLIKNKKKMERASNLFERVINEKNIQDEDIYYRLVNYYENISYDHFEINYINMKKSPLSLALYIEVLKKYTYKYEYDSFIFSLRKYPTIFNRIILKIFNEEFLNESFLLLIDKIENNFHSKQIINIIYNYLKFYLYNNNIQLTDKISIGRKISDIFVNKAEFKNINKIIPIGENGQYEELLLNIPNFKFMFLFSRSLKNISQIIICRKINNFRCILCKKFALPVFYGGEFFIENIAHDKIEEYFLHNKNKITENQLRKLFRLYFRVMNFQLCKAFRIFPPNLIFLYFNSELQSMLRRGEETINCFIKILPFLNLNTDSLLLIGKITHEILSVSKNMPLLIFIKNTWAEVSFIEKHLEFICIEGIEMISKKEFYSFLKNLPALLSLSIEDIFTKYGNILIAFLIEKNIKLEKEFYGYIPGAVAYLMRVNREKNIEIYNTYLQSNICEFFINLLIYDIPENILHVHMKSYKKTILDNPIRFFFFLKNNFRPYVCFLRPLFFLIKIVHFAKNNFEIIKNTFQFIFEKEGKCSCITNEKLDKIYIVEYLMENRKEDLFSYELLFPYLDSRNHSFFNLSETQKINILLNSKTDETQKAALNILKNISIPNNKRALLFNFKEKFYKEIIQLLVANGAVRKPVYINSALSMNRNMNRGIKMIINMLFSATTVDDRNYYVIQELVKKLKNSSTYPYNIFMNTEYYTENIFIEKKTDGRFSTDDLNKLYEELFNFIYGIMEEQNMTNFWNLGVFLEKRVKRIFLLMMISVLFTHEYNRRVADLLNSFISLKCIEEECSCITRAILLRKSDDKKYFGFYTYKNIPPVKIDLLIFLFEINRFSGMEIVSYKYILIYAIYYKLFYMAYWAINRIMDNDFTIDNFSKFNLIFQHYFIFICRELEEKNTLYVQKKIYFQRRKQNRDYWKNEFFFQKIPNVLNGNSNYLLKYIYDNLMADREYEKMESLIHFLHDMTIDDLSIIEKRREKIENKYILLLHYRLIKQLKGSQKSEFKRKLSYEIFQYFIRRRKYRSAKKILRKMIGECRFEAFYFKSFLFKNSKKKAIQYLKWSRKYLQNGFFYEKSVEQIAILKNTERSFKKAIRLIGANENLSYVQGKFYLNRSENERAFYFFKESLHYGVSRLDITIPTLLHIFSEKVEQDNLILADIFEIVGSERLKKFLLQIIPKLNHKSPHVVAEIEKLIFAIFSNHPTYSMWKLLPFFNSTNKQMKNKMSAIRKKLNLNSMSDILKFITMVKKVASIKASPSFRLSDVVPNIESYKNVALLLNDSMVEVEEFCENVTVYKSLQAPKRISFIGKDGQMRSIIIKQNDDLRRDQRMMELFNLINRYLPFGFIRTYGVIPIDSKFGIIEVVENLISLRELCDYNNSTYGDIFEMVKKSGIRKFGKYFEEALSRTVPNLRNSFFKLFSTEKLFINSMNEFIETYAVMSAVGWLIGLGDRHTENITIDGKKGCTVHVDINLIFETGKLLSIPEKVPFRLTKNIIHSFGPMRLEIFRKHFSKILKILQMEKEMIEANLLSFVYDPLIYLNFQRNTDNKIIRGGNKINSFEVIRNKLSNKEKQLADRLIESATDYDNLRDMYIGWAPQI